MNKPSLPSLHAGDFVYDLPPSAIARYPVEQRDQSQLLVAQSGTIEHSRFFRLAEYLPDHSLLVVNSSRVIAARVYCTKPTGGNVEVLLTSPVAPSKDPAFVLSQHGESMWSCLIGGRNVTEGMVLSSAHLHVTIVQRERNEALVRVAPVHDVTLGSALEQAGVLPLPPYLQRAAEATDKDRYQTIYANVEGSVAAPTAGLHFTDAVMETLEHKHIDRTEVLLHVGLGTFKPMDVDRVDEHTMHIERIGISMDSLVTVLDALHAGRWVTVVGTTSLRTLESIYWFGVSLLDGDMPADDEFHIDQWSAFQREPYPAQRSLRAVYDWAKERNLAWVWGSTQLMIAPGCTIGVANALVTNFHQPGNTLLLLVAGFIGDPFWRDIYEEALAKGYRFLSYGDSSLLIRGKVRT